MPQDMYLSIDLLTAAMPGRGDGVAGLVDFEVEHDADTGLPLIKSRTIKGLLVDECSNILFALRAQNAPQESEWHDSAAFLFGKPGAFLSGSSQVQFGSAQLHADLRDAVKYAQAVASDHSSASVFRVDKKSVLESLTGIRRRSSTDDSSGCPEDGSLRSARLILRGLTFYSPVSFDSKPSQRALALLAATIRSLKYLGSSRNRGMGFCDCKLLDNTFKDTGEIYLNEFASLLGGPKS
ncbi:MAG: hypothetical protein K2X27_00455 [Candidatus Obscuribacterales bacterium]|nr:hypothetical protein [Candidatus Obscuribacterales bacterium]